MNLAEPTVKNHVTAVLKTLKVTNRTEAVVIGRNLDWEGVAYGQVAGVPNGIWRSLAAKSRW